MESKLKIGIALLCMALFFYGMNSFVPYYDDDIWYAFRYVPHETLSPIQSASDVLVSQYHHYVRENSRAVVHVVLQSLMAALPERGFDLLNTAVFVFLMVCIVRYTADAEGRNSLLTYLAAFTTVFLLLPDMDYLFYWAAGSLNYLWTSAAVLVFLLLMRAVKTGRRFTGFRAALCVAAAFLSAFSHEALALPAGVALIVYLIRHYRSIGCNLPTLMSAAYGAGCLCLLLAPSITVRMNRMLPDAETTEWLFLALGKFLQLRAFPLVCLLALLSGCRARWRISFRRFCRENGYLCVMCASAILFAFYVGSGTSNMRSFYGAEFFSMLLLLRFYDQRIRGSIARHSKAIAASLSAALIVWGAAVTLEAGKAGEVHRRLFTDYQERSDGLLYVPKHPVARFLRPWVMVVRKCYLTDYESEWRAFVLPLAQRRGETLRVPTPLLSRHTDGRYKLYGAYIRILPAELQAAIETPNDFFIPANKVQGINPFYLSPHSDYMVAQLDSMTLSENWQWIYEPVSWRDPSASLFGFLRRLAKPGSFPTTEPVLWQDTIQLPTGERYVSVQMPRYRRVKGVSPAD